MVLYFSLSIWRVFSLKDRTLEKNLIASQLKTVRDIHSWATPTKPHTVNWIAIDPQLTTNILHELKLTLNTYEYWTTLIFSLRLRNVFEVLPFGTICGRILCFRLGPALVTWTVIVNFHPTNSILSYILLTTHYEIFAN